MADSPRDPGSLPPVDEWIEKLEFRSTAEVKIPERLVDQVIGQEHAVEVIRKAAEQKRHVMLIGDPGTGKSMLARSMTELLPRDELQDIIVYHNPEDPNEPKIRVVPASKGREIVNARKAAAERVEAGAIHKAHRGVLFVDEINLLRIESQQSLLTALQEKKFSIVGQSERSSGG